MFLKSLQVNKLHLELWEYDSHVLINVVAHSSTEAVRMLLACCKFYNVVITKCNLYLWKSKAAIFPWSCTWLCRCQWQENRWWDQLITWKPIYLSRILLCGADIPTSLTALLHQLGKANMGSAVLSFLNTFCGVFSTCRLFPSLTLKVSNSNWRLIENWRQADTTTTFIRCVRRWGPWGDGGRGT